MKQFEDLKIENDPRNNEALSSSGFRNSFERMTKDMTFVGTFLIVYGFINCLTIIGLPMGIPIIFAGLRMREAADHFSFYRITNNTVSMRTGFDFQSKSFRIIRILIIVGICVTLISIILVLVFAAFFINKFSPQKTF